MCGKGLRGIPRGLTACPFQGGDTEEQERDWNRFAKKGEPGARNVRKDRRFANTGRKKQLQVNPFVRK